MQPHPIIFYVQVDVRFKKPLRLISDPETGGTPSRIRGFIREVGCTAASEDDMRSRIAEYVLDPDYRTNALVDFLYIGVIAPAELQKEVYNDPDVGEALCGDPKVVGIWYSTGRGFYR